MAFLIKKQVDCEDNDKPFQTKGDVATYYINIAEHLFLKKYDADCIKAKLKITHKIVDAFFLIRVKNNAETNEHWVLVETKGKNKDYFQQLDETLAIFENINYKHTLHGRFIGKNVPAILDSYKKKAFNSLQQKFVEKKGTLRIGNKVMKEKLTDINKFEITN